jgi:hypothetical protein
MSRLFTTQPISAVVDGKDRGGLPLDPALSQWAPGGSRCADWESRMESQRRSQPGVQDLSNGRPT